ncbi:oligosaccharide flippase family protein [Crocosphaera sp. Alani8]|uniref:oligosaccharide flippase family protein n=1 Tax=Crocosphaera sp. Alani8 TaxID=3038952 RepID=UPI00313CBF61
MSTFLGARCEFKVIALRSLFAVLISGVVGIGMALQGFGVWSLVGQQMMYELVAVVVLWRLSDWRPSWRISMGHFRDLWHFGITTLGFNFLSFFSTRADDFLIGYFLGVEALGLYSLAYRILTIMTQLLVSTSNQVALPTFSRLQENLEQFRRAFYRATQLTSVVAFPTFLGMVVLAPQVILTVFGEQWLASVLVLQILAFDGLRRSVSFFKSSVFLAMDKPHWRLNLSLVNATLNVIAFAIAVRWGIVAVALAYVIRGYIMFPIGQWMVSILIHAPLKIYLKQFLAPLISTILMTTAIIGVKILFIEILTPLALIVICTVSGIVIYGLAIRLLASEIWKDLLRLFSLAQSKS